MMCSLSFVVDVSTPGGSLLHLHSLGRNQSLVAHVEVRSHASGRTMSVFLGSQDARRFIRLAVEIQHSVNRMIEPATGACGLSAARDAPDQNQGNIFVLRMLR